MTRPIRLRRIFSILFFALFMTMTFSFQKANAQGYDNSFQLFYDDLAPYGQWFQDPQYGYVWSPNVNRDFRPYYTNGHWVWTSYGNMWVSNYPWGWAAFHYGRWVFHNSYGWLWIPGSEWGPAWVNWRQGSGYYGWAPLGPGISISVSFGNYYAPDYYWTFVPQRYIYTRSFHRYYAPRRTTALVRHTTIINNTYVDNRTRNTYVTGPRRAEVEKVTGRKVSEYQVGPRDRAGASEVSGSRVAVYRPDMTNKVNARSVAAPREAKVLEQPISTIRQNENTKGSTPGRADVARPTDNKAAPVRTTPAVKPQGNSLNNRSQQVPQKVESSPVNNQRQTPQPARQAQPKTQTINQRPSTPARQTTPKVSPQQQAAPVKRTSTPPVKQRTSPVNNRQAAPATNSRQVAPATKSRAVERAPQRNAQPASESRSRR